MTSVLIAMYVAIVSTLLGVLALTMIARLTAATWFAPLAARANRLMIALPVLAVVGLALLPLLIARQQPIRAAGVAPQQAYLAPGWVVARYFVYWVLWLLLAALLRSAERARRGGDLVHAARLGQTTSAWGLVILAFTMTFASFDWMMSLTPHWSSTIYGVYWFAGALVAALALLAYPGTEDTGVERSMSSLLLALLMLWVYIGFSQYIVIWSANLPGEVGWYIVRTSGAWGVLALALLAIGAAVPFLLLLSRAARQTRRVVSVVAVLILIAHVLDSAWLVVPGS